MANPTCDIKLYNIIVLGIAFMLIFTAFQTCSMAEKAVLQSAYNGTFEGNGYTSLGIIYAVFSVSNWAAPSVVSFAGPKISMIFGSVLYFVFVLSFLKPMVWSLYTGSALVGVGAAILWTAQGNFLTINSDSGTIGRNSGIFWALFQSSLLFGNMYSYFMFRGEDTISDSSRMHLFIGLSGAGLLGVLVLFFLRKPRPKTSDREAGVLNNSEPPGFDEGNSDSSEFVGNVSPEPSAVQTAVPPLTSLKRAFSMLRTKEMLLLSVPFAYTGLGLTFFSSVYGTCIAQNIHFGDNRKGLLGISGMLIGAGEILGGGAFGLFGKKTNRYGRDPIVLMGYILHMGAFYLAFVNMPMDSPISESSGPTYFASNEILALLCSFLLGLGDASINTQIYSLIGFMFSEDSSAAFAIFKFVQSIAAAGAFYYSNVLLLKWQLVILVAMGTGSVMCFSTVEWAATRYSRSGYQAIGLD
ncbi:hypothetical protein ACOMHN_005308 [Nucella lapillus]